MVYSLINNLRVNRVLKYGGSSLKIICVATLDALRIPRVAIFQAMNCYMESDPVLRPSPWVTSLYP